MRLIRSRIHYWSSSRLATWIRRDNKPCVLEWHKWEEWHNNQKKLHPFRYWLSEKFLNKLQNIIYFPVDVYHTAKVYIRNRWIDKIQYLHTGLKPGEYYDLDHRILYGLFNELVDFVELELSSLMKWNKDKNYKFVKDRCQQAQDDYFQWANHLKHQGRLTKQAKGSRKIKELYEWWKYKRTLRKDPLDNPELGIEDITDTKQVKSKQKLYKKVYELEEEYDEEDTKMLIELIKIRHHLWT